MADLEATGDEALRNLMEDVLEAAPDEPGELMDRFLDEIEDQLDGSNFAHDTIRVWPQRYSALVAPEGDQLSPLDSSDSRADLEHQSDSTSPTLARFQACLEQLRQASDPESTRLAWRELESLERQMVTSQAEFAAEPAGTASAEAAAGERLLQEGFEHWLEAFDLAKVGEADQALIAAREGTRLFRAVAEWNSMLE